MQRIILQDETGRIYYMRSERDNYYLGHFDGSLDGVIDGDGKAWELFCTDAVLELFERAEHEITYGRED